MTETIEYVVTENCFVGASVNYPITVQGDTLEEVKEQMKKIFKIMISELQKLVDEDTFEYKQVSTFIKPKSSQ
jgi:predicted RNase H-like HicB family nuclease